MKLRDPKPQPEPQLALDLIPRTHGGRRDGAGRPKSSGPRHDPPHRARPVHVGRYPLHIVLRVRKDLPRLRRMDIYKAVNRSLLVIARREGFRIVHVSIQHNHIHTLVEAADAAALESGMRAFSISLARRINKVLGRTGKVFAYRYHTTMLTSPRQTRNAICYVINNWRRHNEDERSYFDRDARIDRFSSGVQFRGWSDFRLDPLALPADYVPLGVARPQTWLLDVGWLKAKRPIRTTDVPGPLS
jgi:REP element-mobilizing transposase RayT